MPGSRFISRTCKALTGLFAVLLAFGLSAAPAMAQQEAALEAVQQTGLATNDIRTYIANIIRAFFALLGILAVGTILYAGWLWMTSEGNPEQTGRAKKILQSAVIGLVIIFSAYAIAEFVFRALGIGTGGGAGGSGTGGGSGAVLPGVSGSDGLGAGIIEYHFPEPNQGDVARNTRISITFKQPLVLSTVFRNYDDRGTFATEDDVVPPTLELNTDNFKIIPNSELQDAAGGTADAQFDSRYPASGLIPQPLAKVTVVGPEFNPDERQTLVITPSELLGSPNNDVNYRVGLRGGSAGIKVWDVRSGSAQAIQRGAFSRMSADGAYFWQFATGTRIDTTPPKIVAIVPDAPASPATAPRLDRNQLVQVYFNESVDPTSASGVITESGAGARGIVIEARCLSGAECEPRYASDDFVPVPGDIVMGNRLTTAEFTPSAPCENASQNSCGETVYCLPKNVELRARITAASVGDDAPLAAADDGVVDMVGNSLDGNGNGVAEGPDSDTRPQPYSLNQTPTSVSGLSDNAVALYRVGDNVDLIPPAVIDIDPKSASNDGLPEPSTPYGDGGPSKFPVGNPILVTWSKVMSVSSFKTGRPEDPRATVSLAASECKKTGTARCTTDAPCSCSAIDQPWFFIDAGTPTVIGGVQVTQTAFRHRQFFTASDLGYSEEDLAAFPAGMPRYVPILRSRVRDVKQNCFSPSVGYACPAGLMGQADGPASCCDRNAQGEFSCPPS